MNLSSVLEMYANDCTIHVTAYLNTISDNLH